MVCLIITRRRGLSRICFPTDPISFWAGLWIADVRVPEGDSLEKAEQFLTGRNKAMFLDFVRGVLAWRPEDRKTAAELLQHPWLTAEEITD